MTHFAVLDVVGKLMEVFLENFESNPHDLDWSFHFTLVSILLLLAFVTIHDPTIQTLEPVNYTPKKFGKIPFHLCPVKTRMNYSQGYNSSLFRKKIDGIIEK